MTTRKRPVVRAVQGAGPPSPTQQVLDAAFEAIAEAMVLVDPTGRILRANAAFRALLGLPPDDTFFNAALNERVPRLRILDRAGQPLPLQQWPMTRVLHGEHVGGVSEPDIYLHTLDGRDVCLAPSGSPLYASDGTICGGVVSFRDVTARRQAEDARVAALAQTEAERCRLATLLEVLPAGVAIYDAAGRLVEQNDAAAHITGRSVVPTEHPPVRQTRYAMRRPDGTTLPEPATPSGRARRGETFADLACVITGPTGQDVHLLTSGAPLRDEQGTITGAVVVFQDVTPLQQLEHDLQTQRDLAEGIIASTPFGVVVFDASDDFICLRNNAPYLALMGAEMQARGTLVGLPLSALVLPASFPALNDLFIQVRDTGQPTIIEEFAVHLPGDAAQRWYRWSLSPLFDAQRQVTALLGSAIEITEQVRTRQALQQQAAELEGIFAALTTAVIVFDATGRIQRLNPVAQRLYDEAGGAGYHQQAMDVRINGLVLRDSAGAVLPPDRWPGARVLAGETISGEDVQYVTRDGRTLVLNLAGVPLRDAAGVIVGGITLYQDVTARRTLERRTHVSLDALLHMAQSAVQGSGDVRAVARQLAEVTREVLDCVRVGVMAIERETQYVRPLAVVGLAPEEEAQWWAMQPDNARFGEGADPAMIARFAAGELLVLDMTQPPFDQAPNPFGITVALFVPMRLNEEFIGFISLDHAGERHVFSAEELALAQGVADLAALVIERERLQAEATTAQAQALALTETNTRMHTFLGIAGHELRTPVTSIKSSVQLTARTVRQMLDALPDDLKGRMLRATSLLEGANDQADKLNRFITDLLDITHIQAGTLEMQPGVVDLAAIVQQGVAGIQPSWPQRTITLTLPETPVLVWGDADRLGQVITNLVTNALKYSPNEQPVEVHLALAETTARLAVTDHGPGLTVEQQAQLFQAFGRATGIERLSGAGVGLGLGLFICKTIIERHQGAIGVTSQPGAGATFWCSLPVQEGA